ncbi:conserved Plasmodium protein, unknown function [Plasmodium vinckei vinckei]|uniref:Fam-h protein n=1 Tax=Plasmodium vinckei vinckei TaxID=54757 RepID=A0A449BVC1_PLAVN|nr:conserved Plasmodium protein, unknown function [Plasmodium vinckei vinckei]KEG02662.1 hypothetical protein YYE_02491 [Plasmodium vinckei vinckei]VEV57342.1 conserved Plasmodium protein, unknown function [Plasmodium vinckei vinckei]
MKILFVSFLYFIILQLSSQFVLKNHPNSTKIKSIHYRYNVTKGKNYVRSLKVNVYRGVLKNVIEPLKDKQFQKYCLFRALTRICVSLSSGFSLNARISLFRKNINNLVLTKLLVNNEILIKILKIGWLCKLSNIVNKNFKLCRYLSTIFYIISIYIDIFSTFNISTNSYIYHILHSSSSIMKSLSIMTYTSIRSSTNLYISQMLSNKNGSETKQPGQENANLNNTQDNKNCAQNDSINSSNAAEPFHEINSDLFAKNKNQMENANNKIKDNLSNFESKKIYTIGDVSIITELLSSIVDLLTVIFLSKTTNYIKHNLYFYILLSSCHLFFSYKELHYLLASNNQVNK